MMMPTLATMMMLLVTPTAAFDLQAISAMKLDLQGAGNPVAKVITLLKDMQKTIEKEGEEDEEAYEKVACWCVTNNNEKTKSIGIAEGRIEDLTKSIEEGTGRSAQLNTEIANLEKEVAKGQNALDKAKAMRTKELAEFNAEEKDVLGSISALKSAITVLSKHNSLAQKSSFLQISTSQMSQVATTVYDELQKNAPRLEGVLTKSQKSKVVAFNQEAKVQAKGKAHQPSGEIFGIMKAMLESFESNLSGEQKDEATSLSDFTELKASKESEIAAGTEQGAAKTQELATTDEKLAQDKLDLDDTTASLAADEKFLEALKVKCAQTDAEWELRNKERMIELEGVAKALEILTSDDAHDLFAKTFSLVQKKKAMDSKRRTQASKLLSDIARKNNNPRLMQLALHVRLDAFTKVKKAIDDMITQLMKEKKDEIKHRDYCIENLNNNERTTERKDREKKDILANIDDLTMTIDELTKALETLKAEVAELQVQMKRAGEDRQVENKEFAVVVADQRGTQKLLQSVVDVLSSSIGKKAMALAQQEHKMHSGGGVVAMIEQIIGDAKKLEQEAIRSEDDAQKSYEDFVKDSNGSIEEKTKDIINKSEENAKAKDDKIKAEEARDDVLLELEMLNNEAGDLHKACDFVMKNFEIRQTARDDEVEALKQAKSILSGAKFTQYLQFSSDFHH